MQIPVLTYALGWALGLSSAVFAQAADSTDRMIKVGTHVMHVRTAGFANRRPGTPAVILEAGNGQTSETWAPLFANIAAFAPVVAYDRRGLGKSDWDSIPPTLERVARTTHAMLDAAGIAPPYIIAGHSLGGAFARYFAGVYPGEVVGLIQIDPSRTTSYVARRRQAFMDAGATPEELARMYPTPRNIGDRAGVFASMMLTPAWAQAFASLPPIGDMPYALLLSKQPPPPRPASAPPSPMGRFDRAKIEAAIRDEDDVTTVSGSPYHLLIVSTSAGHFIHSDEPTLTLAAFKRIVEFAAEKAASAAKK
jgi:pimeloyl-ACP methyl ester carboxylesterase